MSTKGSDKLKGKGAKKPIPSILKVPTVVIPKKLETKGKEGSPVAGESTEAKGADENNKPVGLNDSKQEAQISPDMQELKKLRAKCRTLTQKTIDQDIVIEDLKAQLEANKLSIEEDATKQITKEGGKLVSEIEDDDVKELRNKVNELADASVRNMVLTFIGKSELTVKSFRYVNTELAKCKEQLNQKAEVEIENSSEVLEDPEVTNNVINGDLMIQATIAQADGILKGLGKKATKDNYKKFVEEVTDKNSVGIVSCASTLMQSNRKYVDQVQKDFKQTVRVVSHVDLSRPPPTLSSANLFQSREKDSQYKEVLTTKTRARGTVGGSSRLDLDPRKPSLGQSRGSFQRPSRHIVAPRYPTLGQTRGSFQGPSQQMMASGYPSLGHTRSSFQGRRGSSRHRGSTTRSKFIPFQQVHHKVPVNEDNWKIQYTNIASKDIFQ